MKLPSILQSLKPAMPRLTLKKSFAMTMILLWCFSLLWLWVWGDQYVLFENKPFESSTTRWLITAVYIIVALAVVMWLILKRLRRLQGQQQQVKAEVKDPAQLVLNAQSRYLSHWLVRLQRHFESKNYIYQLPWYMVIGNKSSGKTTLLKENCKITKLYSPQKDEEVYLDCWLNDKAVIIEPHGEMIDQLDNQPIPMMMTRLWDNLLGWLTETRSRQPLNGLILTIDMKQFCTFGKDERDNYIQTIQNRLLEINKTLQTQLPIYVVLTKMDLLYGFDAAFQSLDKESREQILGATFTTLDPTAWKEELNLFWEQWMTQLNQAMPTMMIQNIDASQRGSLFSFIRQINGIKDSLMMLLSKALFSSDAQPMTLRGLYFTSALQKGQMEDLFISVVSNQYKLPPRIYPTWKNTLSKNYFGYKLLNQHILSEPNLASENYAYRLLMKKRITLFSTLGTMAALGLVVGWHYFYSVNHGAGNKVLEQVKAFRQIELADTEDRYGDLQLPLLNPIRDATLAYGHYYERTPVFADLGLYQGYKIGPYVEQTYLKLLQLRFLPAVMNGLLHELNNAPKESEEKLSILRVMRMIEDESGRNKDIVLQHMNKVWSQAFKGQRDIQTQLAAHLDYALDHVKWKAQRQKSDQIALDTFIPFDEPIKAAQVELSKLSIYQRIYQNLRIRAQSDMPADLDLRAAIGASFDYIFHVESEDLVFVPRLLTRDGLNNYFLKQNDKLIELTQIDSWVLNLTSNVQYSKADREEIDRQITEQYINDYTATWNSAYNNLRVQQLTDIPYAITVLEQLTSGEQPFRRAIQLLKDNTKSGDDIIKTPENDTVKNIIGQQNNAIISRIHREFAKETSVLDEQNEQMSAMQLSLQKLSDLHRYLLAIQNAPSPGRAALKAVQLRMKQNNSDPIFELQQLAKTVPEPLGRWLSELADEVWNVVMIEAIHSLEVEWHETVVKPYKSFIDNRYPFNPTAKQDVPLSEFERFFAPDGILDKFYKQNLKPFVENQVGARTEIKSLIRADVLQQLAIAEKIRKTYFKQQNRLGIQFSIQPIEMSGNKRRGILNLDGQLIEYKQAATSRVNLIWPNSMRETVESKLTLVGVSGAPRSIGFEGPWALLRLVHAGQLTNVKKTDFNVRYTIDGGHITYRIFMDESDNPFEGGLFRQFKLPETLY